MDCTSFDEPRIQREHSVKRNSNVDSNMESTFARAATTDNPLEFQEVADILEEINIARSLPLCRLANLVQHPEQDLSKSNTYVDQTQASKQWSPVAKFSRSPKKSNIFSRKASTAVSVNVESGVRVFYFGLPMSKVVFYDKKSKIRDLIGNALLAYANQLHFDQSKICSNNPELYQLRLPKQQGKWIPDMSIDPLYQQRIVHLNLFDSLVLIKTASSSLVDQQKSAKDVSIYSQNGNKELLTLYNQINEQVGKILLSRDETLEQVFKLVQKNGFLTTVYYLAQDIDDQYHLHRNFEVKHLSFPRIYIKAIKYADQQQDAKVQPFKTIQNMRKPALSDINPPIGINEASMYEEFEVSKLNPFGVEQDRVLGIDQQKIYNYEKGVRKDHREIGFFDRLRGVNEHSGTKRPFRLVSDLRCVTETGNRITLEFSDKSIIFVQKDTITRAKILRKLNFLLSYHKKK